MRLDPVIRFMLLMSPLVLACYPAEMPAVAPNRCLGSLPIGSFRLLVEPDKGGLLRPLAAGE